MWRRIRIGVLLFILASVAQSAWVTRTRTAEWKTSLRVVIYPISADASAASTQYVSELRKTAFDPIETFFRTEGKKYADSLGDPVDVFLAPAISSRPPAPPFGGSTLRIILWSLELRYWAWRNDTHNGPKPDVRLFVSYHDPALAQRLPHSTGLQKGLMGVVNAFAESGLEGSNNVVITHELLHTLGATDKYDLDGNLPLFPDGFADPDARPLYPQRRAEIMAGRIPISETRAEIAEGMKEVVIGAKTAREISWTK
jgi:hypothetical protein